MEKGHSFSKFIIYICQKTWMNIRIHRRAEEQAGFCIGAIDTTRIVTKIGRNG